MHLLYARSPKTLIPRGTRSLAAYYLPRLCLWAWTLCSINGVAQVNTPPFDCEEENWGFENGTLDGWNSAGSVYLVNSGIDPYGGFPWLYPDGGAYSVKLSSDTAHSTIDQFGNTIADYARLSRQIQVPPTGTTFLSFHFAMCIFNFPHLSDEASKFTVRFLSEDLTELECPRYSCYYSTDLGAQGGSTLQQTTFPAMYYNPLAMGDGSDTTRVTYSGWTDVTLDLSGYAGQTISIEFGVDWCIYGVDWSYALVDVDCPVNTSVPSVLCSGAGNAVCAPSGMAWYEWRSLEGELLSADSCFTPQDTGMYYCTFLPEDIQCSDGAAVTQEYRIGITPQVDIAMEGADMIGVNDSIPTAFISDCANGALLTGITNSSTYYWDSTEDSTAAYSLELYATPPRRAVYTFHTALGYCSAEMSVLIVNGCPEFLMPDIFTPNGDRYNEVFKPTGQFIHDYSLTIYNRWGALLFESTQFQHGWDGTVNKEPAPEGTYYYIVRAKDRYGNSLLEGDSRAGSFTLLR